MDFNNDIDLEGAKERFMENEELFKRFLFRFPKENAFADLERFTIEENVDDAFHVAHTMKGVVGNLSLISVSKVLNPIVEIFRKDEIPTKEQMEELAEALEHIIQVIRYIEKNDVKLF